MNKELLQLAESKGYDQIVVCMARYGGEGARPYSQIDKVRETCEIAMLLQWLKEKHNAHIEPLTTLADGDGNTNTLYSALLIYKGGTPAYSNAKFSYRSAVYETLEEALRKTLNFLPDESKDNSKVNG